MTKNATPKQAIEEIVASMRRDGEEQAARYLLITAHMLDYLELDEAKAIAHKTDAR